MWYPELSPRLFPSPASSGFPGGRVLLPWALLAILASLLPSARAITGGQEASIEDYPWVATVLAGRGSSTASGYFCGGALIHPSWVLTAAHCVANRATNELEVAFGVDRLSSDTSVGERYQVAEMFFHPRYLFRDQQHDGDLALLRLTTPVLDRQPVRLLEEPVRPAAQGFFSVAWAHGGPSRALNRLSLSVLDRLDAIAITGEGLFLDAVPVYSGSETLGLCYGDSGTPLVTQRGGEWRLVGVASYVLGNCGGYAVYGDLQFYRDWVVSHVFPEFDLWQATAGVTGLWQDPDGDGVSNYEEFARQTDPRDAEPPDAVLAPVVRANEMPAVRFAHRRETAFQVEFSPDLEVWESLPAGNVLERSDLGPEAEEITVGSGRSLAAQPRQFLRLSSFPPPTPALPARSAFREFYLKGDAAFLRREGRFEQRYHVTDLINGTTTFKFFTPFFSPRIRLIERDTGTVVLDAGQEGLHTLVTQVPTRSDEDYELVLSSMEPTTSGTFTFHYPQLLNLPQNLEINRQPVQDVLDNFSNFDGNYYSKAYEIFGAVPGHVVSLTMASDPQVGGFQPFLVILNDLGEVVAQSAGTPTDSTTVTFTLQLSRRYFAFATTVKPGSQGLFTLSGRRTG